MTPWVKVIFQDSDGTIYAKEYGLIATQSPPILEEAHILHGVDGAIQTILKDRRFAAKGREVMTVDPNKEDAIHHIKPIDPPLVPTRKGTWFRPEEAWELDPLEPAPPDSKGREL